MAISLQFKLHPSYSCHCHTHGHTHASVQLLKTRSCNSPRSRRILIVLSCQNNTNIEEVEPIDNKENKEKKSTKRPLQLPLSARVFSGLEKLARGLKENMRAEHKGKGKDVGVGVGDWKDLMLMSFSFAVYVYMSQKIVCAYFAWTSFSMSIPTH